MADYEALWRKELAAAPVKDTNSWYTKWTDQPQDPTVLAQSARIADAETILAQPEATPEARIARLAPIAERVDAAPAPPEVAAGAWNQLVTEADAAAHRKSLGTLEGYVKRIQDNISTARRAAEELVPKNEGYAERTFIHSDRIGTTALDALEILVTPAKATVAHAQILDKWAPVEVGKTLSINERKQIVQDKIRMGSQEEVKAIVADIANIGRDLLGVPGRANDLFQWMIASEYLEGLTLLSADDQREAVLADPEATVGARTFAKISPALFPIFTVLDILPAVGLAKAGTKSVGRATKALSGVREALDFMRNPLAIDLNNLIEGSRASVKAAKSADPVAASAAMGTDPAITVAQTVMPPLGFIDNKGAKLQALPPDGRVDASRYFIDDAAAQKGREDLAQALKDTFGPRLIDSPIIYADEGYEATVRVGKKDGTEFPSEFAAGGWARSKLDGIPYEIVQSRAGGYQVQVQQVFPYQSPLTAADPWVKNPWAIGRGFKFKDWVNQAISTANRQGDMAAAEVAELFTPIRELGNASASRVQEFLRWADNADATAVQRAGEMAARGFTAKEIDAAAKLRQGFDRYHAEKNLNLYTRMKNDGWAEIQIGTGDSFVRPIGAPPASATKFVDLTTGQVVNAAPPGSQFFQVMDDVARGTSTGFVPANARPTFKPLRFQVLARDENWLPRYGTTHAYVKKMDGGSWVSVASARSRLAGDREVERLRQADPQGQYKTFEAGELADDFNTAAEVIAARELGLLRTGNRRRTALPDVEGEAMQLDFYDSLNRVIHSTGAEVGFQRLQVALSPIFKQRFGFDLDILAPPPKPAAFADRELWREAATVHEHFRLMMGFGKTEQWRITQTIREGMSHLLFGGGTILRDAEKKLGKAGKFTGLGKAGNAFEWLGGEVSGLHSKTLNGLKSVAFANGLVANPLGQYLVQTGAIPVFSAVKGGKKYMGLGGFERDMSIIKLRALPDQAVMVGKAFGRTEAETRQLLDDYAKHSGIAAAMDNQLIQIGTYAANQVGQQNFIGRAATKAYKGLKVVGYDAAVRLEKESAWLVARNRAVVEGKDLSLPAVQNEIANAAEALSMNLNKSDPLVRTDGLASLYTQFAGHAIKATERMVYGTLGGALKVARQDKLADRLAETGLSHSQSAAYGATTLALYGAQGAGLWHGVVSPILDQIEAKRGEKISDEDREMVRQGVLGSYMSSVLGGGLAYSERVSPWGQSGQMLSNIKLLGGAIANWDFATIVELMPSAASLGLAGRAAEVWEHGDFLFNAVPEEIISSPEKANILLMDFLRLNPTVSNIWKYQAGLALGAKVDSRGQPIVQASEDQLRAQLFGVKTLAEADLFRLQQERYGMGGPADKKGLGAEFDNEVNKAWGLMAPVLDKMADGSYNLLEGRKFINTLRLGYWKLLEDQPHMQAKFMDALQAKLNKGTAQFKDEKLRDAILERLDGGAQPDVSFRERVSAMTYKYKDDVLDALDRAYGDFYTEEDDGN